MTVYERNMDIEFTVNAPEIKHLVEKIQGLLYDRDIAQVSSYEYTNPLRNSSLYGFKDKETIESTHILKDEDGQVLMELDYASQALLAQAGLEEYGITTTITQQNVSTIAEEWMRVRGNYIWLMGDFEDCHMEGYGLRPKLVYEMDDMPNVDLVIRFDNSYADKWNLTFMISYEVEKLTDRKAVEDMVVQVPLEQMRFIRENVEEVLNHFSNEPVTYTVECETKIVSEATYQCSPETTNLVMGGEE